MSDIFDTLTIEKPKRDIFDTLGEQEGDIFDKISPPSFFQKAKETISTFAGDVSEGYKQIFGAKPAPAEIPEIQKLQGESTLGLTHPEQAKAGRMLRSDKALQEKLSKISVAMQAQPDFYKGMTPESVLERQTELEKTGTGEVQPSNIDPVEWAAFIVGGGIPGVVKAGLAAGVRAAASQAIKTGLEAAAMGLAQIPIGIATEEIAATGYGKTHPEVATAFNFLANAATLYGLNKALTKLQKTDTWRKMEIRERGLVTQTIEQMKQAQPYGKFKGFTEGEVARMSPEAYKESLAKRMPAESAESSSMKISKALGKENQPAILEKMGIMTEEAKVGQIVNDAVTQKLSAAKAFEAKGKTDLARQAKEEALKNAETIRVADGPTADKAVTEALKKTEKPISAITSEPMEAEEAFKKENPASDRSPEINKIRIEKTQNTKSYADIKNISPDTEIIIYRAIPKEIKGGIESGDFIAIDKEVAKFYGNDLLKRNITNEIKIVSQKIKASEAKLHPSHQAIGVENEFIYNPELATKEKGLAYNKSQQGDILQDGEPVEIDPFEKIKVDKVLPAEGKPAIKPEEVKERFVLEPTEPTEAKIKPTQPDMLGITPEVMEGKIPSVELPETALEQAARGAQTRKVEAEMAKRQVDMPEAEEAPTVKETEAELGEKINEAIGEVIPPVGLSIKKVGAQPGKGITDFKFENPDVETRWKSSYGIRKEPLRQRGRESLHILWHKMSRGTYEHIPRSKEFSQLRFDLLKLAKQKGVSADRTLRNIQGITLNFNRIDRNLFDRKVILEDLAETIEQGKEIPFGFNKESITKELNRLSTEITKNPHIQQALEAREKVWSVLKDEYIKTMEDVGFDVSEKLANKNYFRHQVLDYVKAQGLFGTGAKLKTPVARGFLRKRMGSELDINTDYIQAEYEVMSQMMYDIEIAKTIKMIDKKYNIASKLKKDEPIPEGYTVWQPREGNVFYMADTIPAKLANQLTEGLVEEIGVKATDLNKALAMGGKRKEFVVKEEIALTLNNLVRNKDVSRLMDIDKKALKGWKVWQLISPRRFFKYNIRNLTGDAEGSFLGNPSGFRKTPQAFKELYEVLYGDKSMSPDMKDWFERGGMQTTLQVQEMGELNKLRIFQKQYEIKTGIKDIPEKAWSKYWKNVRLATDFRESILRYANYLDFLEQMKNNPDGLPKSFGASLKEEIIGLSDIEDRAFKMSNELLGAYDDISIIGQALREHLFPFWSWKEINMKRYYRLAKNAVHEGNIAKIAGRLALRGVATTPYKAYKIGKFILKATAFFAGLQAYNHLFFPKEERELDEKTRARPHIILGRNKEGKIITFTRIGILGDLLEWFGLDIASQYVDKWFRDRMSLGEIAKNMAKSPINVLVQGSTPYFKTPAELLSQKKLFPDFSKPVRIRDNGFYLAESLGLGNEYKALSRMPSKPYLKSIPSIFYYEIDTGEAAYSNIYEEKRRFLKEIGKGGEGFWQSPKGDALYNMKLSIRYKDEAAAKDYMLEYAKYGGTREGIVKSLQNMSPVSGLTEAEASAFIVWLDEEGKQNLVKALKFYDNVLLGNQKEE